MPIIPIKAYLWAALLVLLLSLEGWYGIHERDVEHAHDTKVAAAAVARVTKKDTAIETQASTEIQHDVIVFKQAVAVPAVGDLGVVCKPPRRDPVPGAPISGPASDAAPVDGGSDTFDPSGSALTAARKADAKIAALQAIIRTMQAEMDKAARAHQ